MKRMIRLETLTPRNMTLNASRNKNPRMTKAMIAAGFISLRKIQCLCAITHSNITSVFFDQGNHLSPASINLSWVKQYSKGTAPKMPKEQSMSRQ